MDSKMNIVVDLSVFAHQVAEDLMVIEKEPKLWDMALKANLAYLVSADWLGELRPRDINIIFVKDSKPYWRTEYLLRPEIFSKVPRKVKSLEKLRESFASMTPGTEEYQVAFDKLAIHYKGGRKFPRYALDKTKKKIERYCRQQGWEVLGYPGYEADDIAAALVKVNMRSPKPKDILLLTIDSDWMGLVSSNTHWFCMRGWQPRLRSDLLSVNKWAERRLGQRLEFFREIWDIKGQLGDKSDNLPASQGVLLPVIDLLDPPREYRLWEKGFFDVDVLGRTTPNIKGAAALRFLDSSGLTVSIRPFIAKKDLIG